MIKQKRLNMKITIRFVGLTFITGAIALLVISYANLTKNACVYPANSTISGIDVGGLTKDQALLKLNSVFEQPLEIDLSGTIFKFNNEQLGLSVLYEDMTDGMICPDRTLADLFRTESVIAFNQPDFKYILDEKVLQKTMNEFIASNHRVDAAEIYPIGKSTKFERGITRFSIDQDKLIDEVRRELITGNKSLVTVKLIELPPTRIDMKVLSDHLQSILKAQEFDGVVELYVERMSDHSSISLLNWYGEEREAGVAFSAASTMKIPIMVSTFWRKSLPLDEMTEGWIRHMIIQSENDPADRLMEAIDPVMGPLVVTEDLRKLGLKNSFIAGYFYLGAPLLDIIETEANQRQDFTVDADIYNQTTAEDIGKLLASIYTCSIEQQSNLNQISEGQITQEECVTLIDFLQGNRMGALIEAGVPEEVVVAHKHGWSQERDGLVHSFSDAGIVYGPEEDFILTIFTYSKDQLLFDVANPLIARISQTIYNGLNPDYQMDWPLPD
jgi:beta-lactamase class A